MDARTSVHPHTHTRTLAHITLTHAHTQLGIGNRAEDMGLVTQSYVRHDSVTCEKGLIHVRDMRHSYVRHYSFVCDT